MKLKRGSTSVRRLIFIADSSSTTGAGLANLVFNSAGLVAYYFAGDLANEVQITLVTATLGTYTSGGFIAVDNTNMPGWYEVGFPDAGMDGGNEVAIQFRGATNMVPVNVYIELDAFDYQTATQPVNAIQISGDAVAADNAEAFFDGTGYAGTGNTIPNVTTLTTYTGNTLQTGDSFAVVSSGTHGNAALKTLIDAIDDFIDTELAAILVAVDTEVAAIKAKTDNLPASPAAVGSAMVLSATGLDAVLIESAITAGAGLTNDTGTQLTSINARQALAAALSALAGVLSGVLTNAPAFKQAAKPAGNTRVSATVTTDGRTAVTLKVPD